jgi:hypothetical protein
MTRVNIALAAAGTAMCLFCASPAVAERDGEPNQSDAGYLPESWEVFPSHYWLIGPAIDWTIDLERPEELSHHFLVGLSAMHRWSWFSLGGKFLMSADGLALVFADRGGPENIRSLAGVNSRVAFDVGPVEMLYGAAFEAELRLRDHFWLMYATPLELGAVLWRGGSWNIQLLTGVRLIAAGELLNVFVLDPNGVDHSRECDPVLDTPQCDLDRVRDNPWEVFLGITFARKIE